MGLGIGPVLLVVGRLALALALRLVIARPLRLPLGALVPSELLAHLGRGRARGRARARVRGRVRILAHQDLAFA